MSGKTYQVHSYHVNVLAGDAAIHLLIEFNDAAPVQKWIVLRAVLLDGGEVRYQPVKTNLMTTIACLERMPGYDWSRAGPSSKLPGRPLRFDSVVITHWHEDHYEGFIRIIRKGFDQEKKEAPVSFFYYDKPGEDKLPNPITTLFAPNWVASTRTVQTSASAAAGLPKNIVTIVAGKPDSLSTDNDKAMEGIVKWVKETPILKYKVGDLRGVNFFTGKVDDQTAKMDEVYSPAILMGLAAKGSPPGLYCIVSNKLILGQDSPITEIDSSALPGVIDDPKLDSTNHACIVAMVIWKDDHQTISHYTAGDADWVIENAVLIWSQKDRIRQVKAMKLSHHGAASSTPIKMIETFDPEKIIVSAGYQHGHPRWEVLLWLSAYYQYRDRNAELPTKPLYPTNYPYYFCLNLAGEFIPCTASPDAIISSDDKYSTYQKALRTAYGKLGMSNPMLCLLRYKPYQKATSEMKPWVARRYIASVCSVQWPELSPLSLDERPGTWPRWCPAAGHKVLWPRGGDPSILFHRVMQAPGRSPTVKTQMISNGGDPTIYLEDLRNDTYYNINVTGVSRDAREIPYDIGCNAVLTRAALVRGPVASATSGYYDEKEGDENKGDVKDDHLSGPREIGGQLYKSQEAKSTSWQHPKGLIDQNDDSLARSRMHGFTSLSDSSYTFWSSAGSASYPGVAIASTPLDNIVSSINSYELIFASTPTSNGVPFSPTDDLATWFNLLFSFNSFKATGDSTTLNNFTLDMNFSTGDLIYDSNSFGTAIGLVSLPTIPPTAQPMAGLIGDSLILGLATATSPDSSTLVLGFTELLSELYRENPNSIPKGLALFDDLQLKLNADPQVSKGNRNALWFTPAQNYSTIQRLRFDVTSGALPSSLLTAMKIGLSNLYVITKKEHVMAGIGKRNIKQTVSLLGDVTLVGLTLPVSLFFALTFENDKFEMLIRHYSEDRLDPGFLLDWMGTILTDGYIRPDFSNLLRSKAVPGFRRINFTLDSADFKPQSLLLDLDYQLDFGSGTGEEKVSVLLTYSWSSTSGWDFGGMLWFPSDPYQGLPVGMTKEMLPQYEEYEQFQPIDKFAADGLLLKYILPDGNALPDLPNAIADAKVVLFSINVSASQFSFQGCIDFDSSSRETVRTLTDSTVPTLTFDQLYLGAAWTFASSAASVGADSSGTVDLYLGFRVSLVPSAEGLTAGYQVASLSGSIEYTDSPGVENSSMWQVSAQTNSLCLASLYNYFDSDCQDGVMSLLKDLYIESLSLDYTYAGGVGSTFTFSGVITMGALGLDLTYIYPAQNDPHMSSWSFSAILTDNQEDTSTTLNEILQDICGKSISLPNCIGKVSINASEASLRLKMQKVDNKGKSIVFSAIELEIKEFELSFVQFVEGGQPNAPVKRLVVASLTKLPDAPDVPIVGQLEKPFDELYFLYLDDETVESGGGLTADEVDMFNSNVDKTHLVPKEPQPANATIVIQSGCHFTIVTKENNKPTAALDYIFDNPDSPSPERAGGEVVMAVVKKATADVPQNPPAVAPLEIHLGPITISNIGLQFTSGFLGILVDLSVELGPIELSLLGLTLGLDLSDNFTLSNLPRSLSATIDGVAVGFNKPPVVMAGLFEYKNPMYLGGLTITMDPYLFEAAGEYGIITQDNQTFKTVSVFASLQGPLIELEFAEVSDICGGFGYNSYLQFPTSSSVPNFPFFNKKLFGDDPITTIQNISNNSNTITPTNGDYWLAAGLTVNAFQAISMQAVVVIEFDPTAKLGIFADCVSQVPEEGDFKLLYIELGIACVADFAAQTLAIDGTIAPTSFILDPNCHLSGGFAMYYWYGGNAHAGDFVFTVGGYHPAYTPQPWYPVPARMAINWNMDDGCSITGQAYFALTPKACMAGGSLNYNLGLGPLSAYYDAWADFLINFKPFYLMADIGIDVGVRFTLDLWICTIHISVDIGASLHLEGPPFHGYAHIDFWLFGFDIYFGEDPVPAAAVTLETFYSLIRQVPGAPAKDHLLNAETGLIPDPKANPNIPETQIWNVHANTFAFNLGCVAPISSISLSNLTTPPEVDQEFYGRPMKLGMPLQSDLKITFTFDSDPTQDISPFGVIQHVKNVPQALYGKYDSNNDPSNPTLQYPNQISDLLSSTDAYLPAVTSLTLTAPQAQPSADLIGIFSAIDRNKLPIPDETFTLMDDMQGKWIPDKQQSGGYASVESAWMTPELGVDAPQKVMDRWCERFGWVAPAPPKQQLKPSTGGGSAGKGGGGGGGGVIIGDGQPWLSAAVPANFVGSLDEFDLAAPVMTVA